MSNALNQLLCYRSVAVAIDWSAHSPGCEFFGDFTLLHGFF